MIEYNLPFTIDCSDCAGYGVNIRYNSVGKREEIVCSSCKGKGKLPIEEELELEEQP